MGGHAFRQMKQPLRMARLSLDQYTALRDRYLEVLSRAYERVTVPVEPPDKKDHGDIDFLVSGPRFDGIPNGPEGAPCGEMFRMFDDGTDTTPAKANTAIGATNMRQHIPKLVHLLRPKAYRSGSPLTSFALPFPDGMVGSEPYFQIDVKAVSPELFDWTAFSVSHGDFVNMLSPSLRFARLVISEYGFFGICPSLLAMHHKRGRVFLSSDVAEVLNFLGLHGDGEWWTKEFADERALFNTVANMRFYDPRAYFNREGISKGTDSRSGLQRFIEEYVRGDLLSTPIAPEAFLGDRWPSSADEQTSDAVSELSSDEAGESRKVRVDPRLVWASRPIEPLRQAIDYFHQRHAYEDTLAQVTESHEDLKRKRVLKEAKKEVARLNNAYSDAWIDFLHQNAIAA